MFTDKIYNMDWYHCRSMPVVKEEHILVGDNEVWLSIWPKTGRCQKYAKLYWYTKRVNVTGEAYILSRNYTTIENVNKNGLGYHCLWHQQLKMVSLTPTSLAQIHLSFSVSNSPTLFPSTSLMSLCLWLCNSKSRFCLPLWAAYICLLSVETKETDHKAYSGASTGIHAVYVYLPLGAGHTHKPSATLLLPHPMWWGHMVSRQAAQ